jgi:DNA-3-methyladenine glycosylase II
MHKSFHDEKLAQIIRQVNPPSFVSTNNVFHDLLSCIIEQQIHYRSTKHIFRNLLNKAGIEALSLENFSVFEEKALQFIKISMNKVETIARICAYFENNNIDWHALSDAAVRDELASIKGVGTWTIDMILLYTLGRENIFPVDDFHLKKIMVAVYSLDASARLKAQMHDVAEHWGDEKSKAVLYLLEMKKSKLYKS